MIQLGNNTNKKALKQIIDIIQFQHIFTQSLGRYTKVFQKSYGIFPNTKNDYLEIKFLTRNQVDEKISGGLISLHSSFVCNYTTLIPWIC